MFDRRIAPRKHIRDWLTVEQKSAVQDLYGDAQVRLAEKADKGDANAQKALDAVRGVGRR